MILLFKQLKKGIIVLQQITALKNEKNFTNLIITLINHLILICPTWDEENNGKSSGIE
jgi:hypothetical protein